jgi:hypothetical protein
MCWLKKHTYNQNSIDLHYTMLDIYNIYSYLFIIYENYFFQNIGQCSLSIFNKWKAIYYDEMTT